MKKKQIKILFMGLAAFLLANALSAQQYDKTVPNSVTIPLDSYPLPMTQQQNLPPSGYASQPNVNSYIYTPPNSTGVNQDLSGVLNRLNQLEQTLNQMQQNQTQIQMQQQSIDQRLGQVESSTNWYVQPAPGQPTQQDLNPFQLHMAP